MNKTRVPSGASIVQDQKLWNYADGIERRHQPIATTTGRVCAHCLPAGTCWPCWPHQLAQFGKLTARAIPDQQPHPAAQTMVLGQLVTAVRDAVTRAEQPR
jgi:hypothetical protein